MKVQADHTQNTESKSDDVPNKVEPIQDYYLMYTFLFFRNRHVVILYLMVIVVVGDDIVSVPPTIVVRIAVLFVVVVVGIGPLNDAT